MRDSLLRVIAPALPLEQLLREGRQIAHQLRERRRARVPQMVGLMAVIENASF